MELWNKSPQKNLQESKVKRIRLQVYLVWFKDYLEAAS